ncbi:hypothetical protein QYE76_020690 [Lolium multiflorum]|uniref:Reverse transcriptase domain-containing protein n=1 Tax=Lolium multiflorum TaxID=4521 RepID=A0AAD8R5A7_LOLMU|nr:hypothetical protein QYE76_020690 [Lolium multiflorum]
MNELISNAQSAFIKRRSIHDNFLYVKNMATRLHKNKNPSLLLKLDIRKAFDSLRWDYLIDLLQRRGFPSAFRNWITALLVTSSSRVLLNGVAGPPISHGRRLRQGDPLSPLLFNLGIDPLQQVLDIATAHGLLHKVRRRGPILRTSLYADDAIIFLAPLREDIRNLACILKAFGERRLSHGGLEPARSCDPRANHTIRRPRALRAASAASPGWLRSPGHRARTCKHAWGPEPSPSTACPTPAAHRRPSAGPVVAGVAEGLRHPAPAPVPAAVDRWRPAVMPRLSNIAHRAEDYVVIHTSAEMNEEAAAMLTCAAYARFE